MGLSAGVGIAVLILQNLAPTSDSVPTNVSVLVAQLNLLRHQNSLSLGRTSWVNIYGNLSMAPQDLKPPPKQWVIISAAPEHEVVAQDLYSLFFLSGSVSGIAPVNLPNYDHDLDAPRFEGSGLPGITIHGRTPAADFIERSLGNCYSLHRAAGMPNGAVEYYLKNNPLWIASNDGFTWLEVGKGPPWRATPCSGPGN
jgi:hypothetical protein